MNSKFTYFPSASLSTFYPTPYPTSLPTSLPTPYPTSLPVIQQNKSNTVNIGKQFCDEYYGTITSKGLSSVAYFFDSNAVFNYNANEMTGVPAWLTFLQSKNNINKMVYDKLTYVTSVIDENILMIQVSGIYTPTDYFGNRGDVSSFVETFILKNVNGRLLVTNYVFKS